MLMKRIVGTVAIVVVLGAAPLAVSSAQTAEKPAAAATVPGPGPQQLIQMVSQDLLRDLDVNRAAPSCRPHG